jgi:hypothetical protein
MTDHEQATNGDAAEQPAVARPGRHRLAKAWAILGQHQVLGGLLLAVILALGTAAYHEATRRRPTPPKAGWGPARPVYWCKAGRDCDGADHVVFNSYVNTPEYGDERAFVDAKPASDSQPGGFRDVVEVQAGEQVIVRIYVDNDAWEGLVPAGHGTAVNTRARVEIPLTAATRHSVFGLISADNARPRTVWDGTTLVSKEPTALRYVFGSGEWLRDNRHRPIPDTLMEDGTLIGSESADGQFGDSFSDSGLLTFRVRVLPADQAAT